MQETEKQKKDQIKIYGIKIYRNPGGCYQFSVVHSGPFRLQDYDALELKTNTVKMVRSTG